MTAARAAGLLLLAGLPLLLAARWARDVVPAARTTVIIGPPGTDSIRDATPEFIIFVDSLEPADLPVTYRFQLSTRADFAAPLLLDTLLEGDTVRVRPSRPLPERQQVWWRAFAITPPGTEQPASAVDGPRPIAGWLRLIFPNVPNGTLLDTRRPEFIWSSIDIAEPPGPWRYDVNVISVGSGNAVVSLRGWPDTTFQTATDLESNTSYRWEVIARLPTGESSAVSSMSSFVVTDDSSPLTTLLYQNFPNPFPTATAAATCIWFDLHTEGRVRLEIFDLRGRPVRVLIRDDREHWPGRYGRGPAGDPSNCDPLFAWDGTADDGRTVPAGVYLIRLRTPGYEAIRRAVFRGRG
ncbi:MAG TPA: hypothetical protein VMM18_12485 [Gemmatimonadaceae bacterium]|nr:hypothetical protein [Gemmatimonadaceae bacterium]